MKKTKTNKMVLSIMMVVVLAFALIGCTTSTPKVSASPVASLIPTLDITPTVTNEVDDELVDELTPAASVEAETSPAATDADENGASPSPTGDNTES